MSNPPRRRAGFWLVTAATVLVVSVGLSLGRWQLDRAAQKQALAADVAARSQEPAANTGELLAGRPSELLHRQVVLQGEWVAGATVFLDNRQMDGRPGFVVVTPLRLAAGGPSVLVQRGWVARDFMDRNRLPDIDTPAGPQSLNGRLAPPPPKLYELGEGGQGPIRQNIDLAAFSQEWGLTLLPLSVLQSGNAPDGLLRNWPQFAVDVHKHHGYAFQWFGLSALFAFLYVWFQFISPRRRRGRPA